MKYRKLRIAWSVWWGVVAVLLCVLWVRSYQMVDAVYIPVTENWSVSLGSVRGLIGVGQSKGTSSFTTDHMPLSVWQPAVSNAGFTLPASTWGGPMASMGFTGLFVPSWMLVVTFGALSIAPWVRRQFSLRALLLAITVMCVLLGLIVYATRG